MVTIRSFSGMYAESAFRRVVLPAPVLPRYQDVQACVNDHLQHVRDILGERFVLDQHRHFQRIEPKRRIDNTGPSIESGGMMALTREPSWRRASTIGDDSSMRRPTDDTMRSITRIKCSSSLNLTLASILPRRSI